jgi:putative transposase
MYQTAIKYRAYPDSEQETFFVRSFGCCRKVWNLMLADKEDAYKRDKIILHPTPAQYKKTTLS